MLTNELAQLRDQQMKVCGIISDQKSIWEEVANSGNFNSSLESILNEQRTILNELQHDNAQFLLPYEKVTDFLSWTVTQMESVANETDLSPYPSNGFDDIVLAQYLTSGTVIVMNFDKWIENSTFVDLNVERKRIIGLGWHKYQSVFIILSI